MTINEYLRSKGLKISTVAQEMGVTRQAVEQYGKGFTPTARTLKKMAKAMTALGVPTPAVEIYKVLCPEDGEVGNETE